MYTRHCLREGPYNNIYVDSWFQHLRALLEKDVDFEFDNEVVVEDTGSFLNRPISEEVSLALRKLKIKKLLGLMG